MLGMSAPHFFPIVSPRTLLRRRLGGWGLGLMLGMLLSLCFGLDLGVVLLDRFALHRRKFCAVDEKLFDQPPLVGDGGILFDRQHHHECVRNHKQNHQQRQ